MKYYRLTHMYNAREATSLDIKAENYDDAKNYALQCIADGSAIDWETGELCELPSLSESTLLVDEISENGVPLEQEYLGEITIPDEVYYSELIAFIREVASDDHLQGALADKAKTLLQRIGAIK